MGLSSLGIFHTLIGVTAIVAAVISFVKYGKINLERLTGKVYFYFTVITSLTSLGLSKLGGLNPGHGLSVFIVILVAAAYFLFRKRQGHNKARYYENFFLSFSFFLSLLPTVVETFTRIPVGHPLAKWPGDPLIAKTLLTIFVLFVIGSVYQYLKQRKINKSEA
ncbi:hypothetical protein [Flavobacterium sp. 3HN19-14]|uniref:hypothetical protein n=1 Tax=Flavobacterium sp. 3HN19-14 TaxID=3448133 RepID=UPI003EE29DA5